MFQLLEPKESTKRGSNVKLGLVELRMVDYNAPQTAVHFPKLSGSWANFRVGQFRLIRWVQAIKPLHNNVRDLSQPTYIGYKIPPNRQKILKFCI